MGVGVNVISIWRVYIVLLYGLHFNFASCVNWMYCYATEAQLWPHRMTPHMTMGDEKQYFGLNVIIFLFFLFWARTIATQFIDKWAFMVEPMMKHRKLECEIIKNYITTRTGRQHFRKLNLWKGMNEGRRRSQRQPFLEPISSQYSILLFRHFQNCVVAGEKRRKKEN